MAQVPIWALPAFPSPAPHTQCPSWASHLHLHLPIASSQVMTSHTHSTHLSPKQRQSDSSQSQTNGSPSHTTFNSSTLLMGKRPKSSARASTLCLGWSPPLSPPPPTSHLAPARPQRPLLPRGHRTCCSLCLDCPLRILARSCLSFKFRISICKTQLKEEKVLRGQRGKDDKEIMQRKFLKAHAKAHRGCLWEEDREHRGDPVSDTAMTSQCWLKARRASLHAHYNHTVPPVHRWGNWRPERTNRQLARADHSPGLMTLSQQP